VAEQRWRGDDRRRAHPLLRMKRQQCGQPAAGRKTGDRDGLRVDGHTRLDVVEHREDHAQLAGTGLRQRPEPVPAAVGIGEAALLRAQQPQPGAVREVREAGGDGEARGALPAAVQDDEQRAGASSASPRGTYRP